MLQMVSGGWSVCVWGGGGGGVGGGGGGGRSGVYNDIMFSTLVCA